MCRRIGQNRVRHFTVLENREMACSYSLAPRGAKNPTLTRVNVAERAENSRKTAEKSLFSAVSRCFPLFRRFS